MAYRRDHRDGAGGDRADEPLVAEGQQVLEAAAAPGDHDHLDVRLAAEPGEGLDDRARGPRPLDVRFRDEHARGRKARGDRGDDVALGGGVVAGDEPDPTGEKGQRPLSLGREEPFGRELLLEALEGGEVLAEPEALE